MLTGSSKPVPHEPLDAAARLRCALELHQAACDIVRAKALRDPGATAASAEAAAARWMATATPWTGPFRPRPLPTP